MPDNPPAVQLFLTEVPHAQTAGGERWALKPRDAVLLAWLALEGPTSRERLAALLWPASTPAQGLQSLRQRLFKLNGACGRELAGGSPLLALAADVAHDLHGSARLLGGLAMPDAPELDDWLQARRAEAGEREARARQAQAQALEDEGNPAAALPLAQALLKREPLSEAAHRRVMRLHYLLGDQAAALRCFDACEQMLKHEIGARPSADTLALLATVEAARPPPPDAVALRHQALPAAVLRPPRLVGRSRELAALQLAWAAQQPVAVVGEAGLGKSRLLAEGCAGRAAVVVAQARLGDAGLPLSTLRRLLGATHAAAAARHPGRPQRQSPVERLLRGDQPQRRVARWLRARPGLEGLVLDDLHHADAASLATLLALVAEPVPGLRWVLAYRPPAGPGPLADWQAALQQRAALETITLQPLDEAALAELVDGLQIGLDGTQSAAPLKQRTGGNPMFLLEALKQAWLQRAPGQALQATALPAPASVQRLIELRLVQLSADALTLARLAAVAGESFGMPLVEQVLRRPVLDYADALRELEDAQVLRGTQFAHDLVLEAVLRTLPAAVAAHTHAQVAAWLETQFDPRSSQPAAVAHHWIAAGRGELAVPWLAQAAERARQALRNREWLDLLDRQAELQAAAGQHDAAQATLKEAIRVGLEVEGDVSRATQRVDRLAGWATTPQALAEASLLRVNLAMRVLDLARAMHLAQDTLAQARELPDPRVAMECRVMLVYGLMQSNRPAEALAHAEAALPWLQAHGSVFRLGELHTYMGHLCCELGQQRRGQRHHEQAIAMARQVGEPAYLATVLSNHATSLSLAGFNRDAVQLETQALALQQLHQLPPTNSTLTLTSLAVSQMRLAHYAAALAHLTLAEPLVQAEDLSRRAYWLDTRSVLWLHLGQTTRAASELPAMAAVAQLPFDAARLQFTQYLLDERMGRDAGRALARAAELLADAQDTAPARMVRIEQAARQPAERALPALAQLRATCRRDGFLGHVLTALMHSARLAATTHPPRARRCALAALALSRRCEMPHRSPGELFLHLVLALQAAGDERRAALLLQQALAWLHDTATHQVPDEFRHGFLHRHPAHQALQALALKTATAPAPANS